MTMPMNTIITRHPDMLSAEIGGEAVMMSVEKGAYFGLNLVATRIWDLIDQPRSIAELVDAIIDEYNVDPAQCEADVEYFVSDMVERGLAKAV